jgi:hypothetical protein
MDAAENVATTLANALMAGGVFRIVAECDNGEKQRWLQMFQPFVDFYNNLDRITGY